MTTAAELLDATNTAILNALTAQEYSHGSRRKRMAEIDKLRALRTELLQEIEMESVDSMVTLAQQVPPT